MKHGRRKTNTLFHGFAGCMVLCCMYSKKEVSISCKSLKIKKTFGPFPSLSLAKLPLTKTLSIFHKRKKRDGRTDNCTNPPAYKNSAYIMVILPKKRKKQEIRAMAERNNSPIIGKR